MVCESCGDEQVLLHVDEDSGMASYGCLCDITPGEGLKYDGGKLRYSLIPPIATQGLAEVLTYGADKYAPNSWQEVSNGEERYTDALMRHLEAYRGGETYDEESGIHHMAHILANASFLLHLSDYNVKEKRDA